MSPDSEDKLNELISQSDGWLDEHQLKQLVIRLEKFEFDDAAEILRQLRESIKV